MNPRSEFTAAGGGRRRRGGAARGGSSPVLSHRGVRLQRGATRSRHHRRPSTGTGTVVAGASGGIGRAVARGFARRGSAVGLIARGEEGLAAAANDVPSLEARLMCSLQTSPTPTQCLPPPRVEDEAGPIDVWVNVAFTSVFSPSSGSTAGIPAGDRGELPGLRLCDHGRVVAHETSRPGNDRACWLGVGLVAFRCRPPIAGRSMRSRDSTRRCVVSFCTTRATCARRWCRCRR